MPWYCGRHRKCAQVRAEGVLVFGHAHPGAVLGGWHRTGDGVEALPQAHRDREE